METNSLSFSVGSVGEKTQVQLHAIQLMAVQIVELSIKVQVDPSELCDWSGQIQLASASSPYDQDEKTIQVRVRATVSENAENPLSLCVEVVGAFLVDESRFDRRYVEEWAQVNAPMVLYPFLREQVFSLSVRLGIQGLIVPLIEIPTFRVVAPSVVDS